MVSDAAPAPNPDSSDFVSVGFVTRLTWRPERPVVMQPRLPVGPAAHTWKPTPREPPPNVRNASSVKGDADPEVPLLIVQVTVPLPVESNCAVEQLLVIPAGNGASTGPLPPITLPFP